MVFNVFISYSMKDSEAARQLQTYLAQIQGTSVFLSEMSLITGPLSNALIEKIAGCDLFLVLYSKNSHSSTYVQQEIGVAKGNNKMIIPILLDADAQPDAMLHGISYLSIYDQRKRNSEMPKLYNYVLQASERKNNAQALLSLGAIILLGYALFKD